MIRLPLALAAVVTLAACGQSDDSWPSGEGLDGTKIKLEVPETPVPETPMEPGTVSDPASEVCGAIAAKDLIGQADSPEVRQQITEKATAASAIRFVLPGEATTEDMDPNRLNVMIDTTGVVRDLRCG